MAEPTLYCVVSCSDVGCADGSIELDLSLTIWEGKSVTFVGAMHWSSFFINTLSLHGGGHKTARIWQTNYVRSFLYVCKHICVGACSSLWTSFNKQYTPHVLVLSFASLVLCRGRQAFSFPLKRSLLLIFAPVNAADWIRYYQIRDHKTCKHWVRRSWGYSLARLFEKFSRTFLKDQLLQLCTVSPLTLCISFVLMLRGERNTCTCIMWSLKQCKRRDDDGGGSGRVGFSIVEVETKR